MKFCAKCGETKCLKDFYTEKRSGGGIYYKSPCKECKKKKERERTIVFREQICEYKRAYNIKNREKIAERRANEYANKKKQKSCEIKARILPKADNCSACGSSIMIEKHHNDYNKPLEVIYLCHRCHMQWHANNSPVI